MPKYPVTSSTVFAAAFAVAACSADRAPAEEGRKDSGAVTGGGANVAGEGGATFAGGATSGLAGSGGRVTGGNAGFTGNGGASGSGAGGQSAANGGAAAMGGSVGVGGTGGGADLDGGAAPDSASMGPKLGAPFVGVGYATIRVASSDGKAWTTASDPAPLPSGFSGAPQDGDNQWLLRGVCTDGHRYVAVGGTGGDQGLLLVSNDGRTWNVVGNAQANDDCAYGNGVWVTSSRHSADGATWTRAAAPPQSARKIVFAEGRFVSAGDQYGGNVSYTRDGDRWTALPITFVGTDSDRKGYDSVAHGNGRFLAVNTGRTDAPIFEWDGKNDTSFTETPRPPELAGAPVYDVAYGRGAFYIASFNTIYRRPDGAKTWEKIAGQGAKEIYSLVVTDDIFVDPTYWSTDGIHWTKSSGTPALGITKVIATPGQ